MNNVAILLAQLLAFGMSPTAEIRHEEAESYSVSAYSALATGTAESRRGILHRWPVRVLSIGHTIASYQCYGAPSSAYFHHGLDIRADAGSDVIASAGGKVVNIENYVPGSPAYWEVAILDDEGFIWQYHHVERSSIPQAIFDALKTGERIEAGTKIGEVFYWSVVTFGERFHHVHLNILGKGREFQNGFAFLEPLSDGVGPTIDRISLLKNGSTVAGGDVTPPYSISAEVADLILHQKFTVPPNEITIRIDGRAAQTVWKFDGLPGGAAEKGFVHDFYVQGATCGNYGCRRSVVDLGFSKAKIPVFPQTKGRHDLDLEVADFAGNRASKSFSWNVN